MRINRGLVFWGVALVTAGVVALLVQSGSIDPGWARGLWRFWPVILIVIGLAVIAARTPFALPVTLIAGLVVGGVVGSLVAGWPNGMSIGCGGEPDESVTESGEFSGAASIDLDFNCGDLDVSTQGGSGWNLDAGYAGGAEPRVESSADSLSVKADDVGILGFADARQEWSLMLPTDVDLAMTVSANAHSSRLDLADASVTSLKLSANAGSTNVDVSGADVAGLEIDANAGSVVLTADDGTTLEGSLEINAGSIDLCVPESAGVEITLEDENITFSDNLDESGLTREGDTWRSGDGTPAVSLRVDGNAASFTLNPEDGCS